LFRRWLLEEMVGSTADVPPVELLPELERLVPVLPVVLPRSTFTPAEPLEGAAEGFAV
jgi:hypothetical protein